MPSGATFIAPKGWTLAVEGPRTLATAPEPDLHIAVIDLNAATADEAVAAAWKGLHPDFNRRLRIAESWPARDGWDEDRSYGYETSPIEKMVVFAIAHRKGTTWTLTLAEGGRASFEKHRADTERLFETTYPKGYVRESFAGKTAHELDAARAKVIVDSIDAMRTAAGVPGVALALVQHGKVVYEGGLGVRELGKPEKVDAHTRFLIASLTKQLTTLLMAKLVDEQKLRWDEPVTALYPDFKLGDADTTKQVLVKHLICACTGLPRHDAQLFFNYQNLTARGEIELLGNLQPTTKFGETFQYSNNLASAAGFIAGHLAYPDKELGAAYEAAMQSRVFTPLKMTETTFDLDRALHADHASGHELDVDGNAAIASLAMNGGLHATRPSGGAWSSVHDMAKYLTMELAKGKLPDGTRYVSADALLERRKPQVSMGQYSKYGMGLWESRSWGVPVLMHDGSMRGFHTVSFFIPDADTAGVLLVNGAGWMMEDAFVRKTLEVLYDGHREADEDAASEVAVLKKAVANERARLTIPPDPAVTAKLAKRYTSPVLGDIVVAADAASPASVASVVFDVGAWKSPVATRKNDDGTVSLVMTAPGARWGSWGITFVVGEKDGKRTLTMPFGAQEDYVFTERP
jgi:CubicO group peptidase (beta-lactamase class C family)